MEIIKAILYLLKAVVYRKKNLTFFKISTDLEIEQRYSKELEFRDRAFLEENWISSVIKFKNR